jgi:hypothetical protein
MASRHSTELAAEEGHRQVQIVRGEENQKDFKGNRF